MCEVSVTSKRTVLLPLLTPSERQNISLPSQTHHQLARRTSTNPGATMSGKRANLFGQGRPEDPYNERDVPDDAPQRATAAQLAARK
jgi:hypothetical protein